MFGDHFVALITINTSLKLSVVWKTDASDHSGGRKDGTIAWDPGVIDQILRPVTTRLGLSIWNEIILF
jgi:hypothetical protein